MKKITAILALITGIFATANPLQNITLDDFNIGYHGKYVWRGTASVNAPVSQTSVTFSYQGLRLNVWGNYFGSRANRNTEGSQFTEVDYTISYVGKVNDFELEAGFIYYEFPDSKPHMPNETREFFIKITAPTIFNPSLTLFQDVNETEGIYFELGINEDFQFNFKEYQIPFSIGINIGFNSSKNWEFYYGRGNQGLSNIAVIISTSHELAENMTLEPYIATTALVNGAQNGKTVNKDNNLVPNEERSVWIGVSLNLDF